MDVDNVQNILSNIFRTPVAIPELYEHICETCTNYWNEIISTYDPIKNKRIVKSKQNLKTFCILLFITTVTVIKNYNSNKSSHTQQVELFVFSRVQTRLTFFVSLSISSKAVSTHSRLRRSTM
jgi:hypothetical protein